MVQQIAAMPSSERKALRSSTGRRHVIILVISRRYRGKRFGWLHAWEGGCPHQHAWEEAAPAHQHAWRADHSPQVSRPISSLGQVAEWTHKGPFGPSQFKRGRAHQAQQNRTREWTQGSLKKGSLLIRLAFDDDALMHTCPWPGPGLRIPPDTEGDFTWGTGNLDSTLQQLPCCRPPMKVQERCVVLILLKKQRTNRIQLSYPCK